MMTPVAQLLEIRRTILINEEILYRQGFDWRHPGIIPSPVAHDSIDWIDNRRAERLRIIKAYRAERSRRVA